MLFFKYGTSTICLTCLKVWVLYILYYCQRLNHSDVVIIVPSVIFNINWLAENHGYVKMRFQKQLFILVLKSISFYAIIESGNFLKSQTETIVKSFNWFFAVSFGFQKISKYLLDIAVMFLATTYLYSRGCLCWR